MGSTDEQGHYELEAPAAGLYRVRAAAYQAGIGRSSPVQLDPGRDVEVPDFVLRGSGRLDGVARYPDGTPAVDLEVRAWPKRILGSNAEELYSRAYNLPPLAGLDHRAGGDLFDAFEGAGRCTHAQRPGPSIPRAVSLALWAGPEPWIGLQYHEAGHEPDQASEVPVPCDDRDALLAAGRCQENIVGKGTGQMVGPSTGKSRQDPPAPSPGAYRGREDPGPAKKRAGKLVFERICLILGQRTEEQLLEDNRTEMARWEPIPEEVLQRFAVRRVPDGFDVDVRVEGELRHV